MDEVLQDLLHYIQRSTAPRVQVRRTAVK